MTFVGLNAQSQRARSPSQPSFKCRPKSSGRPHQRQQMQQQQKENTNPSQLPKREQKKLRSKAKKDSAEWPELAVLDLAKDTATPTAASDASAKVDMAALCKKLGVRPSMKVDI